MTHVSPTTPPPHTSQFTFPKKHIITNTLVSFTESLCVSLPSQKSLFPNKQITKILESTDMALGLPSSCPTRLHACPSSFFFFFLKKMRDMAGCNMVSAKKTNENLKHTSHADWSPPFPFSHDLLPCLLLLPLRWSPPSSSSSHSISSSHSVQICFPQGFPLLPFSLGLSVCVYLYFAFIFSTNPHVNRFFLNLSLYIYLYIYIYTYN